jgi:N-acetylmuramoyl-L-alanine amidase
LYHKIFEKEAIKVTAWINDYVVKNKFSRPGHPLLKVLGIVMHWTATPGATDENEKAFFDGADGGGSRYASAHIFVDRDSARLIIPLNEVAYHANEKPSKVAKLKASASYYTGGNANLNTIGVEMCVEKDGTIHADTIKRTEDVVAEVCRQFSLNPEKDIYRHYDITGKNCPAPWVANAGAFNEFKTKVSAKMMPEVNVESVANSDYVGKTLTVKTDGLWYYDTPRWDVKGGVSAKGDSFFVTEEIRVNGVRMLKCHDGKYRTADPSYIDVNPRPYDWPYRVNIENITHAEAVEIVRLIGANYKGAKVVGEAK